MSVSFEKKFYRSHFLLIVLFLKFLFESSHCSILVTTIFLGTNFQDKKNQMKMKDVPVNFVCIIKLSLQKFSSHGFHLVF